MCLCAFLEFLKDSERGVEPRVVGTLPETNSLQLKIDLYKKEIPNLEFPPFSGVNSLLVSGRVTTW